MHELDGERDERFDALLRSERARLVRLCATLSGDPNVAEDLAQDTLLEAWRHRDRLQSVEGAGRWLSAIAHNACLRWRRRRCCDQQNRLPLTAESEASTEHTISDLADDCDVELDLERAELARLLDHALALLTPEARVILIGRYIEDLPQAEVAARLGLSEPAVAMRVQRGKLALRRLLATELRDEAAAYGISVHPEDRWTRTRIWCWKCGVERLLGHLSHDRAELVLRCPRCCIGAEDVITRTRAPHAGGFAGVRSYASAVAGLFSAGSGFFQQAAAEGVMPCIICSRPAGLLPGLPAGTLPYLGFRHFVRLRCQHCGAHSDMPLHGLTIALREGWEFQQTHTRIRMLPEHEVDMDGDAAIMTTLESIDRGDQLHALYTRDSCRLLAIHHAPPRA